MNENETITFKSVDALVEFINSFDGNGLVVTDNELLRQAIVEAE